RHARLAARGRLRGAAAPRSRRRGAPGRQVMRARLLLPLLWLPLAVLATSGVVGPSRARADEAPPAVPPRGPPPAPASGATAEPAAVARLTPEELEILRRRFPDWDQRDVGERERIASNVLKLR